MEKRIFALVLLAIPLTIFLFNFVSSQLLNASLNNPTTYGQDNQFQIYNITVNDTNIPSGINFTVVNITAPLYLFSGVSSFNTSTNATNSSYVGATTGTLSWTNNSKGGLIANGTLGYFWFYASINYTGYFNITITTNDTSGQTNITNVTVLINDTIPPSISFVAPTDGVTTSSPINYSYIRVNVTANDSGSGLNTTTIYLYNSTYNLVSSQTSTSSPFFYNFTSLADGIYYINATANDSAGNNASTSTITLQINTTVVSACTPNWTETWGSCINNTETYICTDTNNCNTTLNEPSNCNTTQACVSSANNACVTSWQCGDWTPSVCDVNGTQTRTCTDANGCSQPEVQTRNCTLGSSLGTNTSQQNSSGFLSSSTIFFIVVVIIILGTAGLIFVLVKLKKKSSQGNFGNENGGYKTYAPRGPPPGPPGFPNNAQQIPPQTSSQQGYQNNFRNY